MSKLTVEESQHQYQLSDIDSIAIKNFLPVTNWFYRGGQPDATSITELKKSGFRTIISLRWNLQVIKVERVLAKERQLNFFSIPLSYWVLPTRMQIDYFLSILDDESKRPIYLHCKHGQDRTGMLTAIYRIARENWTADEAYAEMKSNGFRYIRMHQLKWAVYGFERCQKQLTCKPLVQERFSSNQLIQKQSEQFDHIEKSRRVEEYDHSTINNLIEDKLIQLEQ